MVVVVEVVVVVVVVWVVGVGVVDGVVDVSDPYITSDVCVGVPETDREVSASLRPIKQ